MRIAIGGAGAVGRSVAQELVDNGHKVLLIEQQWARYEPSTVPGAATVDSILFIVPTRAS